MDKDCRLSAAATNLTSTDDHPSISDDIDSDVQALVEAFFSDTRYSSAIPPNLNTADSYSHIFRSCLEIRTLQRGKISCLLTVKPAILNSYDGMHGGAVAAVAEMISVACCRTVVGKDKEVFLGELSTAYLSAVPDKAKAVVDGSVVRSGRNLTVVAIEFKLEGSGKLVYTSRATFYHLPTSSL